MTAHKKKMYTFSGTHPFDPTVLVDTDADESQADQIVWDIEHGRCPRCEDLLPTGREFPAGSRITRCRTIPICRSCGVDEGYEAEDTRAGIGYGYSPASYWPVSVDEIIGRRIRFERDMRPAILSPGEDRENRIGSPAWRRKYQLITEDGATPVTIINPCNTGGWAEFGGAPPWARDEDDGDEETP